MARLRTYLFCIAASGAASCATGNRDVPPPAPNWAANGWLSPGRTGDPEIIGLFTERAECEQAVADWLARQVVGNPIDGACLPIDSR
ncbi:MAG: hypothetical protein AB7P23_08395 [Amphiplicatus sp.]